MRFSISAAAAAAAFALEFLSKVLDRFAPHHSKPSTASHSLSSAAGWLVA